MLRQSKDDHLGPYCFASAFPIENEFIACKSAGPVNDQINNCPVLL